MQIRRSDRLFIDVSKDLGRIDAAVTRLIMNRSLWSRFLMDPNGVLIEVGLHPAASPDANARANKCFYAMLTNRPLLAAIKEHFSTFEVSHQKAQKYRKKFLEGLHKSVIVNDLDFDLDGLNHILKEPEVFRKFLLLALEDLNQRGILQKRHPASKIREYVDDTTNAIVSKKALREFPVLERWDGAYGIGAGYGAGVLEVGVGFTAGAVAEFAVAVTQLVTVEHIVAPQSEDRHAIEQKALLGDLDSLNAVDTLGRMADFLGQLLVHTANFGEL